MGGANVVGARALEPFDIRAEDEPLRIADPRDLAENLRADRRELGREVEERNAHAFRA